MLFNANTILVEEYLWYDLTHIWGGDGVNIFPKCISQKINVKVRLEFELPNYDVADQHVNNQDSPVLQMNVYLKK